MPKSWVSSLLFVCVVTATVLIGATVRADLANQDWSGSPWPPVQGANPPPPPGTWVKELSTASMIYATAGNGPTFTPPIPAPPNPPSLPFGSFTIPSSATDYGIAYYYKDAGDNLVDSIQTVDIAITGPAIHMSLIARRKDGSPGTHYGVLVGGATNYLMFYKRRVVNNVDWTFSPIGQSAPQNPAYGKSILQTDHWYRLYFKVTQLTSGCPPGVQVCTQLKATVWDLSVPNPPDYDFESAVQWTHTVVDTEPVLQNRLGRTALHFRTGGAWKYGYFDNYSVKSHGCANPRNWSFAGSWAQGTQPTLNNETENVTVDTACPGPMILDRDFNVASLTVAPGATLRFENEASRTLSSKGSVVVYGTLEMKPGAWASPPGPAPTTELPGVVQTLRITGANERGMKGKGMGPDDCPLAQKPMGMCNPPLFRETDIGLWATGAGRLDLRGTPRKGWLRAHDAVSIGASAIQVDLPSGSWDSAAWRNGDSIWVAPSGLVPAVDNLSNHFAPLQQFEPFTLATDASPSGAFTVTKADNWATCNADNDFWCWSGQTCDQTIGKCKCDANSDCPGGSCDLATGKCSFDHPRDPLPNCDLATDPGCRTCENDLFLTSSDPSFATCTTAPEVLNATRNVIITGMPPKYPKPANATEAGENKCAAQPPQTCSDLGKGRAHIFIRNDVPTAHSIKHVAIKNMGPRKEGYEPNGTPNIYSDKVLGRYGLHFHHCTDDGEMDMGMTPVPCSDTNPCVVGHCGPSTMEDNYNRYCYVDYCAETEVTGVVVSNTGSHAFVAHHSDRIKFEDDVAFGTVESAFWWDSPTTLSKAPWIEEEITSNRIEYEHCLAALNTAGNYAGHANGFMLGIGFLNSIRDSVAVGIGGGKDASGFEWPDYAAGFNNVNDSVWTFTRNVTHNDMAIGTFLWQNDSRHHVLDHFIMFRNLGVGNVHGAYGNSYIVQNSILFGNGGIPPYGSTTSDIIAQMTLNAGSVGIGYNRCFTQQEVDNDPTCSGTIDHVLDGEDYQKWLHITADAAGRSPSIVEVSGITASDEQMRHASLMLDWKVRGFTGKAIGVQTALNASSGQPNARVVDFVDWQVWDGTQFRELTEQDFRKDNFDAAVADHHTDHLGNLTNNYSRLRVQQSDGCWFTLKAGPSQTFVVDEQMTTAYCGPIGAIDPATHYCCGNPFFQPFEPATPTEPEKPEVYRQDYPCGVADGPCCADGWCFSGSCNNGTCP